MPWSDLIWTGIGFLLSLFILSYIFGDNPLFRFALYLFIGVSAGLIAVIVIYQVLIPRMVMPLLSSETVLQKAILLIPILLSALLLFKLSPKYSKVGNLPMAYLVGVGAAILIGGAVFGSIIPQTGSTIQAFGIDPESALSPILQIISAVILLAGTISSLVFFNFGARQKPGKPVQRPAIVKILSKAGQVFIAITLGSVFSGVLISAITALVTRLSDMGSTITTFIH